jgi:acyl-CoA dehydrogenase
MSEIASSVSIELDDSHHELELRAAEFGRVEIGPHEDDESDEFALAITKKLGASGLLDVCVNLDVRGICLVRETVAAYSGLVDSMVALQGLGYAPIALAGNESQKQEWRERVRLGEAISAFAITEPDAGSDVGNLKTTATIDGDGWRINGEKHFITNAGIADFYLTFARTSDDGSRGISAFIVPAEKVEVTERFELMAAHPCGALRYNDVFVPKSALVGEVGDGFKIAMATLDRFRCTVGAAALGLAKRALDEAIDRSKEREQFGKPISRFQQVAAMLADSFAELISARLLVYRAASARDAGQADAGLLAASAKLLATENAQKIIDRSVQIHGGIGVKRGTTVERLYREVRALRIYEGTSEIQRVVISRGLLCG